MADIKLYPGFLVKGKWNNNQYKIIQLIGAGGIGQVYKVEDEKKKIWALKISRQMQSITKEYEMLKRFSHIDLVPKVNEIDDFCCGNNQLYYIVMEYIDGKNLKEYIKIKPMNIKAIIGLTLLIGKAFLILHKNNFVFGDLKLENLMIDAKNNVIRIIDLGGVTHIGSSVKEFTPLYDRASWNMGLRRADEKYDLFSLSMFCIILLLRKNFTPGKISVDKLIKKLKDMHISKKLVNILHKGIRQDNISFEVFLKSLEDIYINGIDKEGNIVWDKQNFAVNVLLVSSILLFIGIMYEYL
ncbi:protein kinase domain-containing protein [Crassaminicella indica]|uniref:Protein kinase n=1 Tax=Crassaminicella indica TaxID=2855394 RepID=A0ABX8RDS8_9CLOT|nr:protein kinase [Crassaminicella indica]QXM07238.1 protein kinase [Crassaminicella indica]